MMTITKAKALEAIKNDEHRSAEWCDALCSALGVDPRKHYPIDAPSVSVKKLTDDIVKIAVLSKLAKINLM